ncbi:hypothetical protein [Streptomyces sp. NPDC058620]
MQLTQSRVRAPWRQFAPMTIGELDAAGAELAESLEKLGPGARVTVHAPG